MENHSIKRERFKRLAAKRTNNVLKALDVLSHCANLSAYEYTDEEIAKIFNEIEKTLRFTKMKFKVQKKTKFEL